MSWLSSALSEIEPRLFLGGAEKGADRCVAFDLGVSLVVCCNASEDTPRYQVFDHLEQRYLQLSDLVVLPATSFAGDPAPEQAAVSPAGSAPSIEEGLAAAAANDNAAWFTKLVANIAAAEKHSELAACRRVPRRVGGEPDLILHPRAAVAVLNIAADDFPSYDMLAHWRECTQHIHAARHPAAVVGAGAGGGVAPKSSQPGAVIVHCAAGVSRSVSTLCAYLMHRDRVPRDVVMGRIVAVRAIAGPNSGFMDQLLTWEATSYGLHVAGDPQSIHDKIIAEAKAGAATGLDPKTGGEPPSSTAVAAGEPSPVATTGTPPTSLFFRTQIHVAFHQLVHRAITSIRTSAERRGLPKVVQLLEATVGTDVFSAEAAFDTLEHVVGSTLIDDEGYLDFPKGFRHFVEVLDHFVAFDPVVYGRLAQRCLQSIFDRTVVDVDKDLFSLELVNDVLDAAAAGDGDGLESEIPPWRRRPLPSLSPRSGIPVSLLTAAVNIVSQMSVMQGCDDEEVPPLARALLSEEEIKAITRGVGAAESSAAADDDAGTSAPHSADKGRRLAVTARVWRLLRLRLGQPGHAIAALDEQRIETVARKWAGGSAVDPPTATTAAAQDDDGYDGIFAPLFDVE